MGSKWDYRTIEYEDGSEEVREVRYTGRNEAPFRHVGVPPENMPEAAAEAAVKPQLRSTEIFERAEEADPA